MSERYMRQTMLEEIGEEGQKKLKNSHVLVVGAGGLGSPTLYYLVGAGVGHITVIDCDVVSMSNLNRQILHFEKDINREKVVSAAEKLSAFSSDTDITPVCVKLDENNVKGYLKDVDCVASCLDNLDTRLILAGACQELDIPEVEGGVNGFSGFVMSYRRDTACIGCLYGNASPGGTTPVIGATPGVAGSMEAMEVIKILLGKGQPLYNRAVFFNLKNMRFDLVELTKSPNCPVCGNKKV